MTLSTLPAPFPTPRVVHCKRERFDVYIGRPSKWGNPFQLAGRCSRFKTQSAADPIVAYREWILSQPELMAALPELRGKVLGCWCKPAPCHGDVPVGVVIGGRMAVHMGSGPRCRWAGAAFGIEAVLLLAAMADRGTSAHGR